MRERGEDAGALVKTADGFYTCAIIADWEMEHVWELLMACEAKRGGPYQTFTQDFDWCLELYKEANEGMCAIITGDGGNKAACGSRFGCAWCTVTGERDKSMEAMIATAPDKHITAMTPEERAELKAALEAAEAAERAGATNRQIDESKEG